MADRNTTSDYMDMLLAGEPLPASATGSWDDPPPPPPARPSYLKTLLPRAVFNTEAEGRRLAELGKAGLKEQARDLPILGHGVNAWDAYQDSRYPAMAGNALLSLMDITPASKTPGVRDAALRAWKLAEEARPAQVAEALAAMTTKRMKSTGPAAERRAAAAERATPQPDLPPSANGSPQIAQRQLDTASREWPGKAILATAGPAAATGIPGLVIEDAAKGLKSGAIDPMNTMYEDMAKERASEKEARAAPKVEGSKPEVDSYWNQLDTPRRERERHLMAAGAMGAAGGPTMYATGKAIPWAARNMLPAAVGLGAELSMAHPLLALLGLPIMAAGALPWAVPGALGWGGWELAKGTAGQTEQALKSHSEVKALTPLVRKLAENYRADQQSPPSLTPDQAY